MFSDLTNNSKNAINLNQVKAYPSVNSPNDGGFNSESNLRWLAKRFTSKPFITGQTHEDIDNAFTATAGAGDGTYIKPGMVALDGYTIKFAKQQNLDFDDEITDDSAYTVLNTQYLQRFAHTLTGQGTQYQLSTNLDDFVYPQYRSTSASQVENWQALDLTDKCPIGYIYNVYTGSFYDQLTISETLTTVSYGNTIIDIDSEVDVTCTPEEILSITISRNKSIAGVPDTTEGNESIVIFYPVYVKNKKVWSTQINNYMDSPIVYFTDIFGLTFERVLVNSNSKVYPTTNSQFIDCVDNKFLEPESNGGLFGVGYTETSTLPLFDQYAKTTLATKILDYLDFYSGDARQVDPTQDIQQPTSVSNIITSVTIAGSSTPLFEEKTLLQILSSTSESQPSQINNTTNYYCLSVPDPDGGENISVAFMTSDGYLCPDGFATGGNVYPDILEGYLHWLRRRYIQVKGGTLDTVTVDTLLGDWGTVKTDYNTYIAPAMCAYINICYNSLVQYANDANANITDAQKIKSIACGNALNDYLLTNPTTNVFLADNDLNFTQLIQYTGYSYNGTTQIYDAVNKTDSLTYRKDITSDSDKLKQSVITNATGRTLINNVSGVGQPITDYLPVDSYTGYVVHPTYIEDPINLLRRCSYAGAHTNTITDVPVYTLNGSVLTRNSSITMGTDSSKDISFMLVDKFLMPVSTDSYEKALPGITKAKNDFVAHLTSHEMVQRYTKDNPQTSTIASGMCLSWSLYTWYIQTPLVISLNKDALNYLIGNDVTNPGHYGGAEFGFRLPQDVAETDLQVAYLTCSTSNVIGSFDIETSDRSYDTISKDIRQHREPFIHFNKLYGDNFETLDDKINDLIDINMSGIQSQIDEINVTLGLIDTELNDETTGLSPRVSALETATADIPTMQQNISDLEETSVRLYLSGEITVDYEGTQTSTDTHLYINQEIQPGLSNSVSVSIDAPDLSLYNITGITIYQGVKPGFTYVSGLYCEYYLDASGAQDKITFVLTNNSSSNITFAEILFRVLVTPISE